MAIEIERKFLLRDPSWRRESRSSTRLRDGLLASGDPKVRVRIAEKSATICIKLPKEGIARLEFEYAIPLSDAATLLSASRAPVIEKTRHIVPYDGDVWEIDEYHGVLSGLVLAEIELQDQNQKFGRPAWLGREVTGDPNYRKEHLVRLWQGALLGRN